MTRDELVLTINVQIKKMNHAQVSLSELRDVLQHEGELLRRAIREFASAHGWFVMESNNGSLFTFVPHEDTDMGSVIISD
jgi:hypothetical protein